MSRQADSQPHEIHGYILHLCKEKHLQKVMANGNYDYHQEWIHAVLPYILLHAGIRRSKPECQYTPGFTGMQQSAESNDCFIVRAVLGQWCMIFFHILDYCGLQCLFDALAGNHTSLLPLESAIPSGSAIMDYVRGC